MPKIHWASVLAWLLAAFFLVGAYGNTFVSPEIAADYARWGYPDWFHYVTAVIELTTAILLAWRPLRLLGALLGCAVMSSAAATVLLHAEYSHAIPPAVVLALSAVLVVLAMRERNAAKP